MAPTVKWHLKGKPYDVQMEAMRRVRGKERYGFFLEQGLGKTALQINDYIENCDLDTGIVICPNSFKKDWTLAPKEWGVPEISTGMWPDDGFRAGTTDNPHFNIINFEAVRSSGYDTVVSLMKKRPVALIVDESSMIKNFKSQTARAVLDLAKRTNFVRLLNGTPLTQNVMDLFPQLKALGQLDKVNPYAFRNRFAVMGGWMGKQIVGVTNEAELHEIQAKCTFRALKTDWTDLPEKVYIPVHLDMTNKQRKHYREMLQDFYTLVEGEEFTADMVIVQMDKLRQITSGILIRDGEHILIEEPSKNPKIKAALDIMESGTGKMIIVHYYTVVGEMIYNEMRRLGLNPSYLRGGMKPDEIIEQKDKFNNDNSCRVKVAQISASSMSHTLLGSEGDNRCHKMFFHDLTFSLRDKLQMDDRIHRGAQDKTCLYYHPIMSQVDEAQIGALGKKSNLADAVVNVIRATKGKI